jgi:hypothetical protein
MIKVLKEEPVSYLRNDEDFDDGYWIYKNPTKEEIEKIPCEYYRILTYENDYYLATGYSSIHKQMASLLYEYNRLSYNDYGVYIVNIEGNYITTGDRKDYSNNREEKMEEFKLFIPRLKEIGLINDYMEVRLVNQYISSDITIKDFYNI